MRNLISFIIKNIHWLLFLLLIFISVFMLVNNNAYQRSKYLVFEHEAIGRTYMVSNSIISYIGLRSANTDLLERTAELETRIQHLENTLKNMQDTVITDIAEAYPVYSFMAARVVNNKVSGIENYITLNKGSLDGVTADMGVFSPTGVVGIVKQVSKHFSIVIPILNPKFHLSCKVKQSNHFGSLVWDGKSSQYAYLDELPRHVDFSVGDTVVTSGYSAIFPEGVMVGVIVDSKKQKNDNFNSVKIELSTDFTTLSGVLIAKNRDKEELTQLESMK